MERNLAGLDGAYHMAANPDVKFTKGDATDKVLGYPPQTRFYDIGTPDRLEAFETLVAAEHR